MKQFLHHEKMSLPVLIALFLSFQSLHIAHAEDRDPYAKIRVPVSDRSMIVRLHDLGVDIERSGRSGRDGIDCIARGETLDRLRAEGIPFEIIVADLERFYAGRLTPGPVNALGFGYGSMGGYYTLNEIRQQLDSMRHVHPEVVGTRDSIGASFQGRPIWAVRMTANPDAPPQRPQVLYFAMQHANETMGMMTLLYFMWYLAEQYGQDPEATYLLQNRELWFIPIVNVDGYEANRRINPNGGGMRRKNMRNAVYDNDNNGVDLNRNWGAEWGYDNLGSSSYPSYWDYRGTGPFSEPETQVVRDFSNGKAFRFVLEYHTYWNTTFYPPSYTFNLRENADSLLFRAYVRELTRDNHYSNGNTVGAYPANGVGTDWFYENPPSAGKTYPFLTEIGDDSDGSWAPTIHILPLASANLKGNLFSAWAGGAYAKLQTSTLLDSSSDGNLLPGERFTLQLKLRNFGQDPATNASVSASSALLQIPTSSNIVGSLAAHAETTITIQGRVPMGAIEGVPANIIVIVKPGGLVEQRDTIKCVVGPSQLLFADNAENEPLHWLFTGGWGKTAVSHTGQWSFTDSPSGFYPDYASGAMTLLTPVHIPESADVTQLRFWVRWDTEPGGDYGQIGVSSDGGKSWNNVYGEHASYFNRMSYTGWQPEWLEETIDISSFVGKDVHLRFMLASNDTYNADGWYIDDITIRSFLSAGLAFAHDVRFSRPAKDTLRITVRVENPLSHTLKVVGTLNNGSGTLIDSLFLRDDGLHGDSASADGLWGYMYVPKKDDILHVSIRTDDLTAGTSRVLPDAATYLFTRAAMIVVDTRAVDLGLISMTASRYDTSFMVRNIGYAADSLMVSLDPGSVVPDTAVSAFPKVFSLAPGDSQKVTFSIRSNVLSPSYYVAQVIVDSKSSFGQQKFHKNYQFQVVISSIADLAGIPAVIELGQNYPNPFNPSTTIRYGLPNRYHVTLTVFNTLGQQVAILQDGEQDAGYHEVRFEGSGLSSAVYFYRLRAGDFTETKRLLLLR